MSVCHPSAGSHPKPRLLPHFVVFPRVTVTRPCAWREGSWSLVSWPCVQCLHLGWGLGDGEAGEMETEPQRLGDTGVSLHPIPETAKVGAVPPSLRPVASLGLLRSWHWGGPVQGEAATPPPLCTFEAESAGTGNPAPYTLAGEEPLTTGSSPSISHRECGSQRSCCRLGGWVQPPPLRLWLLTAPLWGSVPACINRPHHIPATRPPQALMSSDISQWLIKTFWWHLPAEARDSVLCEGGRCSPTAPPSAPHL